MNELCDRCVDGNNCEQRAIIEGTLLICCGFQQEEAVHENNNTG